MKTLFNHSVLVLLFLCLFPMISAQESSGYILPPHTYPAVIINGDTVAYIQLRTVYIYPPINFLSRMEQNEYSKLVHDVKKVLPLAKIVYATLIETSDYLETLPNDKQRNKHLKRMQTDLLETYTPELKKLSLSQGKLLIKLINRECNQSSFELIKAYMGTFQASLWQAMARMFNASLKTEYNKNSDKVLERVCIQVENGSL